MIHILSGGPSQPHREGPPTKDMRPTQCVMTMPLSQLSPERLLLRSIILATVLAVLGTCAPLSAQTPADPSPSSSLITKSALASVTFYSNKTSLLGGLPGAQGAAFKGRLFWGDKQLAFMEPGHFITFAFAPGKYYFTAASWLIKSPTGGYDFSLDVEAGHHYFLEATSRNLPPFFGLNLIKCDKATKAAGRNKPLERVHISPDGAALVVQESAFPTCS